MKKKKVVHPCTNQREKLNLAILNDFLKILKIFSHSNYLSLQNYVRIKVS